MDLRIFIKTQIDNGKTDWESKSALIRAAGEKINGYSTKILKEYEKDFCFEATLKIKNKAIKKYFDNQIPNSFISVEGAVNIINQELPKNLKIGETIIYNRLNDMKFNIGKLKGQSLDNQVSKTKNYNINISSSFQHKIDQINLKSEKVYLNIEDTKAGNKCLRLKIYKFDNSKNTINLSKKIISGTKVNTTFPPNEDSIKKIKQIINEQTR